jgi:hypothetical protein
MVSGETGDYYEDANMTFWTCRDGYDTGGRFDNLGGTGSLRERMRITSNGNVGIGTNNPGALLHVNGVAVFSGQGPVIDVTPSNPGDMISKRYASADRYGMGQYALGATRLFTSTAYSGGKICLSGATDDLRNADAGFTDYVTVKNNGYVGIGTGNPESKLEVRGSVQASTSDSDNGVYVHSFGSIHRDFGGAGAGIHITAGAIWPTDYTGAYINGGITWGSAAYRWGQIFSTSTSISNSDRNLKQDINDITESEKNVATKITDLFKTFRFKDAVSKKGDDARLHNGIIAQDLIEVFESEGLDAHRYGLFCYDEKWTVDGEHELMETIYEKDGISEYTNEDGEVVKYTLNDEGVEAVKRRLGIVADKDTPGAVFDSSTYSIRYEELLCFVVSAFAKNEDLQAQKAKVATLETQVADLLARVQTLEGA